MIPHTCSSNFARLTTLVPHCPPIPFQPHVPPLAPLHAPLHAPPHAPLHPPLHAPPKATTTSSTDQRPLSAAADTLTYMSSWHGRAATGRRYGHCIPCASKHSCVHAPSSHVIPCCPHDIPHLHTSTNHMMLCLLFAYAGEARGPKTCFVRTWSQTCVIAGNLVKAEVTTALSAHEPHAAGRSMVDGPL